MLWMSGAVRLALVNTLKPDCGWRRDAVGSAHRPWGPQHHKP
jgi:hypothetical protein